MRTKPAAQTLGFFEVQPRAQWVEAMINWKGFDSSVPAMHRRPDGVLLVAL